MSDPILLTKRTYGFVDQDYDASTGELISQVFVDNEPEKTEWRSREPIISCKEHCEPFPFNMVQPTQS